MKVKLLKQTVVPQWRFY